MAGGSDDQRARARRRQQANVPGGREHSTLVRMSADEKDALAERAEQAGVSVPRLMVESALAESSEPGRAHAVLGLLELDDQLRRIGNNLNQLTRWAHQEQDIPEHLGETLHAVVHACLSVDEVARWVMGKPAAVSGISLSPSAVPSEGQGWGGEVDAGGERQP